MIGIEGDVFEMGGESFLNDTKPIRKIRVSSFWMGEFLVTQIIWDWVMRDMERSNPSYFKGSQHPAELVSWEDICFDFLPRLNRLTKSRRPLNTFYRLPTEAEWEYAARGGKYGEKYRFIYTGSDKLDEVGWYIENSHQETKTIGLKTANLLGLYDMSGNIIEWCNDWYGRYRDSHRDIIVNPIGSSKNANRVCRGGSSFGSSDYLRTVTRDKYPLAFRGSGIGFRLALSSSPFKFDIQ
jgi:formylglycine-generating enzyme required for sulfatase activity